MLQVKKILIIVLMVALVGFGIVSAEYIPSNKDTRMPPDTISYVITEPTDMQLLYEIGNYKFYFRDVYDVLAIYDKRNDYTWKTGLDIEFDDKINARCTALLNRTDPLPTDEEKLETCTPLEDRMNRIYEGVGNSLLTMEYYNVSLTVDRIGSAAYNTGRSTLVQVNGDPSHYRLDVTFDVIDVMVSVHIYFSNRGMKYEIRDEEITGRDTDLISAFVFNPFFGAVGGQQFFFDLETDTYIRTPIPKPRISGYAFVPDGSGALIRFVDNSTSLSQYIGNVYGNDYSQDAYHTREETNYVTVKDPSIPVYGVAHGNRQAAFVGYATKGAEYMEIVASPHANLTPYTYVFPRFTYNNKYTKVYNQSGSGYSTLFDDRNHFDIEMTYQFLAGDGESDGYPADYVGMAKLYRTHLLITNQLHIQAYDYNQIPIRLDFVMSDAMKAIVGYKDVVVTTIDQVEDILTTLNRNGVYNINSGLYGFQRGGITLGKKSAPNWTSAIGTYRDFNRVFENMNEMGIDLSLAQNYSVINEEQMTLIGNAAKHLNGWYIRENLRNTNAPVVTNYFAKPTKSVAWLNAHIKAVAGLDAQSITIEGMSSLLYGDYGNNPVTASEAMYLFKETFDKVSNTQKINATNPNMYLWGSVDRFLQAPMFTSQFLIQTDTVPFLQLILNGTMEVYAPYSNFSFYTNLDILRMIDYNVYPSFVLTNDSSYPLMSTNSSYFYSTEFVLYEELIKETYATINNALKEFIHEDWIDRIVLAPGVIKNVYSNDKVLIVNYTDQTYDYFGNFVPPVSYRLVD